MFFQTMFSRSSSIRVASRVSAVTWCPRWRASVTTRLPIPPVAPMTPNGDPVPGYQAPEGGAAPDAAHRVCTGIAALADAAWPHTGRLHARSDFQWSDFDAGLLGKVRPAFPELPPAGVALALRIWGHLHGLVSLEIYGHLRTQTVNPGKLFHEELAQLVRSLGIEPEE